MKFLSRSLIGLFLLALTLGLLFLAIGQIYWAVQESQSNERPQRTAQEREFAVNVDVLAPTSIVPIITAYGNVESWRSLEIRVAVAGEVTEVSPDFRDGGHVEAGQILIRVDPAKFESAVSLAETVLAEAKSELKDAQASLVLTQAEYEIAVKQNTLREQAMARQEDLKARGVATDADIEVAALALASSEQALLGQQQSLAQVETRIWRAEIAVSRQEISLIDTQRTLAETVVTAPFSGVLSGANVILGGLVSTNDALAELIDPSALEIGFRVSNAQFSRLLDEDGNLRNAPLVATLELDNLPFVVEGVIERASARVGDGQTGRLLYARLSGASGTILRPGDFLTVEISEAELDNIAVIPAAAVTSEGMIFLLDDESRVEEVKVTILRRQADTVIISDVPFGREYITARSQQIGVGIKVRPLHEGIAEEEPTATEMITLDDERRAKLIAFIEGNQRMPTDAKERILAQLQETEVPVDVVERLESRMGD